MNDDTTEEALLLWPVPPPPADCPLCGFMVGYRCPEHRRSASEGLVLPVVGEANS